MDVSKFVKVFANSLEDLVRNFWTVIAGLIIFIVVWGLSKIGGSIAGSFQTSYSNIVWTVIYFLVLFVVGSFVFSGLIGVAGKVVKKKKGNWNDFFGSGKKFWFRNFLVLILLMILFNGMNLVLFGFRELMILLIPLFEVSSITFRNLSFLVGFAYLIAFFIFFSFTQFFVVLKDRNIWAGIKNSWHFVKMNYLETLAMMVIFFVVFRLLRGVGGVGEQLIVYGLALPYLSFLWTRFILGK